MDTALALELFQVHNLSIVIPHTNISATYGLETDKFTLSRDGLKCALPSEADYKNILWQAIILRT